MWLIDLENAPPRLRGRLSRWGVEVRAGLYVGSAGGKTREAIWNLVCDFADATTNAVMVIDSRGPQGFEIRTWGPNRREIVDVDGLWLAEFKPLEGDAAEPEPERMQPSDVEFDLNEVDPEYLAASE